MFAGADRRSSEPTATRSQAPLLISVAVLNSENNDESTQTAASAFSHACRFSRGSSSPWVTPMYATRYVVAPKTPIAVSTQANMRSPDQRRPAGDAALTSTGIGDVTQRNSPRYRERWLASASITRQPRARNISAHWRL